MRLPRLPRRRSNSAAHRRRGLGLHLWAWCALSRKASLPLLVLVACVGVLPAVVDASSSNTRPSGGGKHRALIAHASRANPQRRASERPAQTGGGLTSPGGSFSLGKEVPDARTAKSKTYVNAQGVHTARIFSDPVNFRDGQGDYKPIDNTLVQSSASSYAYENKANGYKLRLPADLGNAPVKVTKGSTWVAFSLRGARARGAAAGASDSFRSALPGLDAVYTAQSDSVKEALVLHSDKGPHRLSYRVDASQGLRPKANAAGGIDFKRAGKTVFSFAPPYMYDSAGATSNAVSMKLGHAAGGWKVSVTADRGWLASAARKFPVTVDPTLEFVGADQDCTIAGGASANSNLCPNKSLDVGYDGSKSSRALAQFNVQNYIPSDSEVFNARLGLYLNSASTAATTSVGVHQVNRSWTMGSTWNRYDGTNAWTAAGGDFNSTAADTQSVSSAAGWKYWYPTQLVQDWVKGTKPNDGFLVKQAGETTNQLLHFQATTVAPGRGGGHTRGEGCCINGTSPFLDVSYEQRIGQKRFYKLEKQALDDRMDMGVNVAGGNLLVHNADLRVKGTGLNLGVDRYYNNQSLDTLEYGGGWNMSTGADVQLISFSSGTIVFYDPSGAAWKFAKNADGSYKPPSGLDAKLTKNADSTYSLKYNKSSTKWTFGSDGVPTSQIDKNDNKLSFAYTTVAGVKSVSQITDTQGRVTKFGYNAGGFLSSMTDPAGRLWQYAYDRYGELITSFDPAGGRTDYYWDTAGDLVQITDPVGKVTVFGYDAKYRVSSVTRVTDFKWGTGPTTKFAYSSGGPCGTGDAKTVVTDPDGHDTSYCYDQNDLQGKVSKVVDANGHSRSKSYTANANVQTYTSGSAAQSNASYDSNDNVTSVTAPTGAKTTLGYSDTAHPYSPTSLADPQGNSTSYQYDTKGNVNKITNQNAAQNTSTVDHNANGTVSKSTDANGNVTSYGYDAQGNLTSVTPPSPLGKETLTYDGLSRITSVTDGKAQKTSYTYDAQDRVTKIAFSDGTSVSYAFDVDGNRTSRTSGQGATSYSYDALNRLTNESFPGGKANAYGYDAASNMTSFSDAGGLITYGYDPVNLVTSATEPGSVQTTFGYDSDNNRTRMSYPNGVTTTNAYDSSDRLTSTSAKNSAGSTLKSSAYSYTSPVTGTDSALRWSVKDEGANTTKYGYDLLARLASATTTNSAGSQTSSYTYGYDGNGNATNFNGTSYAFNAANEVTNSGYGFDANGNQTAGGGASALAYNAANQTTSITPSGGTALSLAYAGNDQGERTNAGSISYTNTILGLGSETGSASTYYTRDNKGSLLGQRTPQGRYYYLFDGLGSVVGLTDSSGNVVTSYKYDPYGKQTSTTGTVGNPWRFAGQYYDSQTGLYKMGARYYNPTNARWTQQDPIRQIGSFRQSDRYPYAGDDPINLTDPSGLYFGESWVNDAGDFVSENADTVGWGALTVAAGGLTTFTFLACEEGTAGAGTPECLHAAELGYGATAAAAGATIYSTRD